MTQSEKAAEQATAVTIPEPTSSFSLAQYYRERLENARRGLPQAALQLKAAGVSRVVISYDGCGDSGQIEDVGYFNLQSQPVAPSGLTDLTEEQLKDLFYDLLESRHAGWENNDGGFGEFEWNLEADTLNHTHNDRYTECDTTEHEGL